MYKHNFDKTILKYVKDSDITIHAGDLGNEKLIKTIRISPY